MRVNSTIYPIIVTNISLCYNLATMRLFDIFKLFLKVGTIGFSGGTLPVIHTLLVKERKILTEEEFVDGVTISQALPGPIVVCMAAYCGYKIRGAIGAVIAETAYLLPSFISVVALTYLYLKYGSIPAFRKITAGISVAIIVMILSVSMDIIKNNVKDYQQILILAASFVMLSFFNVNIIVAILVFGLSGIILYRKS